MRPVLSKRRAVLLRLVGGMPFYLCFPSHIIDTVVLGLDCVKAWIQHNDDTTQETFASTQNRPPTLSISRIGPLNGSAPTPNVVSVPRLPTCALPMMALCTDSSALVHLSRASYLFFSKLCLGDEGTMSTVSYEREKQCRTWS